MVLKLHGSYMSTCTKRVMIILKEKNVPFEFVNVDVRSGEHKSAAYKVHQPFGQIPYLNDDGFILYESRAIGRYIALKYEGQGTKLIPPASDLKATGLYEQAASIETADFDSIVNNILMERVFSKFHGRESNEVLVAGYLRTFAEKLDAFDVILGKNKYLAGKDITLPDLFAITNASLLKGAGVDILEDTKRPNVLRWWKDITSRPSWAEVQKEAAA